MKKILKTLYQKTAYWIGIVIAGVVIGLSLQFVRAWSEPAVAPPNGNVGAPINTSNMAQSKAGGLILNTGGAANGLLVPNGNVGIGTNSPSQKLDVNGYVKGATGLCIAADCRTSWPAGAGGVSQIIAGSNVTISPVGGTGAVTINASGGLGGSGTANYVSKWTAGTALGNSQIFDNATNVGIGQSAPAYKLDINGTLGTVGGAILNTGGAANGLLVPSGNVGIGTNSPSQKLDVNGYVRGATGLCIAADCRTSWPSGGGGSLWTANGSSIYYNSGNVGIGTTSPTRKLYLSGLTGGNGIQLDSPANEIGAIRISRQATDLFYFGGDSGGNSDLDIQNIANANMRFYTNNLERVRIDNSGNVGIGTTSPSTPLQVGNGAAAIGIGNGANVLRLQNQNGDGYTVGVLNKDNGWGTLETGTLTTVGGAWLNIGGAANGLIVQSGNVGIGTVSPAQKLDVNGYVRGGTGLCIGNDCQTSWPKCKKKTKPVGVASSCDQACAADGLICVHAEWPPRDSAYACLNNSAPNDNQFYCVCCPM